jgi:AcrR family transcriptional regulator
MAPSNLRETVLRASVDFIAEHGADGLSFRQVAAAAGVSHQAPYHHFADRKAIFRAIAFEGYTKFGEAMRTAVATGPDPAIALLESYVDFALDHRGHFRVMFRRDLCQMEDDPELEAVADASFDVLVDHVRAELGPKASIDDIRARAASMWSLAHGLATLMIDGPLEDKIGPIADRRALIHTVAIQSRLS